MLPRWERGVQAAGMIGLRHGKMQDGLAGLLLAAIAIPVQLATAHLAGMPAEAGLFAFAAGGIGFAIFGTNRYLSAGADSTIAPIFAGGLAAMAVSGTPHYVALAGLLSVMVGVVLIGAALLRAGWVADLLSVPVVTGFLAGVAVHIVVGQLPAVLGVPSPTGSFVGQCLSLWRTLPGVNLWALGVGLSVFLTVQVTEKVMPTVPGALLALVLAACVVALWHPSIDMLGALHPAMPVVTAPSLADAYRLVPLALIVAVVCMMQTAGVLRAYPSQPEGPLHVARDFAGIGAGSILAGLAGAFPVNASPPRTAVVVEAGGSSQWAGLIAVALALNLLFWGGELLAFLPHAALGGILIAVAFRIFRLREMIRIAQRGGVEIFLVLASALLVIVLPIETGMALGVVFSLLNAFYIVARPHCVELLRHRGTTVWWPLDVEDSEREPGILVFAPAAPLNFTNTAFIRRQLKDAIERAEPPVRLVVIEASGMIDIDYTGAGMLIRYIEDLRGRGIDVAIARLSSDRASAHAERTGLVDAFGRDHVFRSVEEAVKAAAASA